MLAQSDIKSPLGLYKKNITKLSKKATDSAYDTLQIDMIIQRAGGYGFKISTGNTTLALNPPSSKSKHKVSKFRSDIVLISIPESDWNGVETATHGEKEPFVIFGPGAYEVGDIRISGYATSAKYGDVVSEAGNTIYVIEIDDIRLLALGGLSHPKLPAEVRSEVDDVGVVLVPIGDGTLGPKEAHELVTSLEPKAIIPYAVGKEEELKAFLKAEGETNTKPQEKFTVRAKELAAMDGEVVLLE